MKMEIKVIAIAPNDGWAFIVREDKAFLLRPPYVSSNQIEVSDKDLETAFHLHSFEECDFSFSSLPEVIRFLKDKYVESMKNRGIALPSSDELRELLKYATDEILLEYLRRAEEELIPEGKLDAAESIALELMRLEKVREKPEIYNIALGLLGRCKQKREEMEKFARTKIEENQRETWGDLFSNVVKKYPVESMIGYKRSVCRRGQLLPVAA